MHSLLPCHKLPKAFHYQGLSLEFVLHAATNKALDNLRSMVQNKRHNSFLVEISRKKGVKTVVYWILAHI